MAISTVDEAIAGMQPPQEFLKGATGTMVVGRPISLFYMTGFPGAAVAPSPGIGGAALTSYTGQIPWTNPTSGNKYLARFAAHSGAVPGTLLLCDRLWHNSGLSATSTSEQVFTDSVQIPARDVNGTNSGLGVYGAVEVSGATGSGTPTLTLKYTNSNGDQNKTATNIQATANSTAAGTFFQIGLATGDLGIRKAQSLQLSATWNSGTIHVVLYRVIARLELPLTGYGYAVDMLTAGFPRVYNDSVPFLVFIPAGTTSSNVGGQIIWTEG